MRAVSHLLPPAYVFEGMRSIIAGRGLSGITLLWGACLAACYILIACWFFLGMYRRAVRTGLIARYSAETLS
jgi:ABC-2 type transport system permease protein